MLAWVMVLVSTEKVLDTLGQTQLPGPGLVHGADMESHTPQSECKGRGVRRLGGKQNDRCVGRVGEGQSSMNVCYDSVVWLAEQRTGGLYSTETSPSRSC